MVRTSAHASSSTFLALFLGLLGAAVLPQAAEAQVLNKLKEKAKQVVEKEAVQKTEELLENAIRCVFDDPACIEKAKAENKPVVLTDQEGTVLTDENGEPVTDPAQLPPKQGAQAEQPPPAVPPARKLEVRKITLTPAPSWENDPAVVTMKNQFLIGKDLWNAETGGLVTKDFVIPGYWRLVAGRLDLLFNEGHEPPAWGFVTQPFIWIAHSGKSLTERPNASHVGPGMEICGTDYGCTDQPIQGIGRGGVGPFLSGDYRRVVYIQEGDLWRGEIDWMTLEIVNRKQVTQVGLLPVARPTDAEGKFVHWYGNTLFMNAALSKEKPILKIDLLSGAVEELPTLGILNSPMTANPSGYRLCALQIPSSQTANLACYDMHTGETSELSLDAYVPRGLFRMGTHGVPFAWIDDETLVSHYSGNTSSKSKLAVATPAGMLRIDFRTGQAEVLFEGKILNEKYPEAITNMEVLPGGRHLMLNLTVNAPPQGSQQRKVRLAVDDGEVVELTGVELQGVWLDEDKFLYPRQEGGISEIGTWVFDVASGMSKKMCHLPAVIHPGTSPSALYYPEFDAIYFHVQGPRIFTGGLGERTCQEITSGVLQFLQFTSFRRPPVDLRLGLSGDALWQQ